MKQRRWGQSAHKTGFLDRETSVIGELHFDGMLRIDGTLSGSIKTSDSLIVGATAVIQADISAKAVQVFGTVSGSIECDGPIAILAGGCVRGNVQTSQLTIEQGGRLEGFSRPAAERVTDSHETNGSEPR